MPLVLVTGISTSGKSSVAKVLLSRGYEAYDTERNGISAYFNIETGERAAEFGEAPNAKEWLNKHEWLMSVNWVEQKVKQSRNKLIFLCGGASNEVQIREICDAVIWLKTDEETIKSRVNNQREHDYGTRPHELAKSIKGNKVKEKDYKEHGALIVDVRQSISGVVDEILDSIIG